MEVLSVQEHLHGAGQLEAAVDEVCGRGEDADASAGAPTYSAIPRLGNDDANGQARKQ